MNRALPPDTRCYRCDHPNGDHDHPGGACGAHTSGHHLCPCDGMRSARKRSWRGRDHTAAWLAWDAAHNAEAAT